MRASPASPIGSDPPRRPVDESCGIGVLSFPITVEEMEDKRPTDALRIRFVPGIANELTELRVSDCSRRDRERIDLDVSYWTFLVLLVDVIVFGPHSKFRL